jgi:hypothetical protein
MHKTTNRFWKYFYNLPESVQKASKKNFELLKTNPFHPSLGFKKVGKLWSLRVTIKHRAIALKDDDDFIWFWIGTHEEYERIIREKS